MQIARDYKKSMLLFLIPLGMAAFFIGQNSQVPASVAQTPDDGLSPYGQYLQRMLQEEEGKPKLEGLVNGVAFVKQSGRPSLDQVVPACSGTAVVEGGEKEAVGSLFDFVPSYLPVRAKLQKVTTSSCNGQVFVVARDYVLDEGGDLSIFRQQGPAFAPANYSTERLRPQAIGGRAAVIVRPLFPLGRATIHLMEGGSSWQITAVNLSLDEVIKVAEGIETK